MKKRKEEKEKKKRCGLKLVARKKEENKMQMEEKKRKEKRKDEERQMNGLASVLVMPITKDMPITKMTVSKWEENPSCVSDLHDGRVKEKVAVRVAR